MLGCVVHTRPFRLLCIASGLAILAPAAMAGDPATQLPVIAVTGPATNGIWTTVTFAADGTPKGTVTGHVGAPTLSANVVWGETRTGGFASDLVGQRQAPVPSSARSTTASARSPFPARRA